MPGFEKGYLFGAGRDDWIFINVTVLKYLILNLNLHSPLSILILYSIMSSNSEGMRMIHEIQRMQIKEKLRKNQNAIGTNMIRDIQEQRRREESAEANRMIEEIRKQQQRARNMMRKAETRKRVKPPPSRRQLNRAEARRAEVRHRLRENHLRRSKMKSNSNSNSKTKKNYTL